MKKIICFIFVFTGLMIAACGSIYDDEPVGIGRDASELKKSPCACLELKKTSELPEWVA